MDVPDGGGRSFVQWKLWSQYLTAGHLEERFEPSTEEI